MNEAQLKAIIRQGFSLQNTADKAVLQVDQVLANAMSQVKRLVEVLPEEGLLRGRAWKDLEPLVKQELNVYGQQLGSAIENALVDAEPGMEAAAIRQAQLGGADFGPETISLNPSGGRVQDTVARALNSQVNNVTVKRLFNLDGKTNTSPVDKALFRTVDTTVRAGMINGTPTEEIARQMIGEVKRAGIPGVDISNGKVSKQIRSQATAMARTATQDMARQVKQEVYDANADAMEGMEYEWTTALDSRTCETCSPLDGRRWKDQRQVPSWPLHPNCRCQAVPVDPEDPFWNAPEKTAQVIRPFEKGAYKDGYKTPIKINGEKFYRKAVPVTSDTPPPRYSDVLAKWATSSETSLVEALGPTRARWFKKEYDRLNKDPQQILQAMLTGKPGAQKFIPIDKLLAKEVKPSAKKAASSTYEKAIAAKKAEQAKAIQLKRQKAEAKQREEAAKAKAKADAAAKAEAAAKLKAEQAAKAAAAKKAQQAAADAKAKAQAEAKAAAEAKAKAVAEAKAKADALAKAQAAKTKAAAAAKAKAERIKALAEEKKAKALAAAKAKAEVAAKKEVEAKAKAEAAAKAKAKQDADFAAAKAKLKAKKAAEKKAEQDALKASSNKTSSKAQAAKLQAEKDAAFKAKDQKKETEVRSLKEGDDVTFAVGGSYGKGKVVTKPDLLDPKLPMQIKADADGPGWKKGDLIPANKNSKFISKGDPPKPAGLDVSKLSDAEKASKAKFDAFMADKAKPPTPKAVAKSAPPKQAEAKKPDDNLVFDKKLNDPIKQAHQTTKVEDYLSPADVKKLKEIKEEYYIGNAKLFTTTGKEAQEVKKKVLALKKQKTELEKPWFDAVKAKAKALEKQQDKLTDNFLEVEDNAHDAGISKLAKKVGQKKAKGPQVNVLSDKTKIASTKTDDSWIEHDPSKYKEYGYSTKAEMQTARQSVRRYTAEENVREIREGSYSTSQRLGGKLDSYGNSLSKKATVGGEEDAVVINDFLQRAPKYEGQRFRGTGFKDEQTFMNALDNYKDGKEVMALESWSDDAGTAEGFAARGGGKVQVMFHVANNKKAVGISSLNSLGEQEILAPAGSRYRVKGFKKVEEFTGDDLSQAIKSMSKTKNKKDGRTLYEVELEEI